MQFAARPAMRKTARLAPNLPPVCRLGLATRGNTNLRSEDVEWAIERGINYLNWCGKPDGMSHAIARLAQRRKHVVVAVQLHAQTARDAKDEFAWILEELKSDYLDVATFYYVESESEWEQIVGPEGAWEALSQFKNQGTVKLIGLTSHQRRLAAGWAQCALGPDRLSDWILDSRAHRSCGTSRSSQGIAPSKPRSRYFLDLLMVRYNAAHRGAENDVFPVTRGRSMPVVTFTGLRWRALLEPTQDDPAGFQPPDAAECYRFCLGNPNVAVILTAPGERSELEHSLSVLDPWRPLDATRFEAIRRHGDRVRNHAGAFW